MANIWTMIIIIIVMCQVCCRHRRSRHSNPLCRQFSWQAHCWEILFLLRSYSDCLYILCVVFLCFWYHRSFHSIFAFLLLVHQLSLYHICHWSLGKKLWLGVDAGVPEQWLLSKVWCMMWQWITKYINLYRKNNPDPTSVVSCAITETKSSYRYTVGVICLE